MQLQVETFTFCCREYCTFGTFEERFEVSLDAGRKRAIGSFSQEKREVLSQDIDRTTTTSEISEKALFEGVDTLRHCARTPVLIATTENLGLSNLDGDSLIQLSLAAWEKERKRSMFCDVIHLSKEVIGRLGCLEMWTKAIPFAFERQSLGANIEARVSVSFRDSANEADVSHLEFIHTNGITGFLLPWKVVDKVSSSFVNTYDRRISDAICTLIPDDSIVRTLMGDAGMEVAMARVVEYWISVEKYEKGSSWLKRLLSK